MPDPAFADPRLAELYDPFDPDRGDLEVYAALAAEFGARSVLDIGCGTGTFACLLAERGFDVTGVDPAGASLDVARRKPYADRVRWVHGTIADLPQMQVDLATMTGNVAQVFLTDEEWAETLRCAGEALRPGGLLVFETRDPAKEAWRSWNRDHSYEKADVPGFGVVETWDDLVGVSGPFVTFRGTFAFERDGTTLVSESTLRFRSKDEVAASLAAADLQLEEVRDAPDRPGLEFVFLARRTA